MSQPTPVREAIRDDLTAYLRETRPTTAESIVYRLVRLETSDKRIVGFRRAGREVLIHEPNPSTGEATLSVHEVLSSGKVLQQATVGEYADLSRWLERHHHYLEWIHPDFR